MVSDRKFNVGDKVAIYCDSNLSVIANVSKVTKTGMFYVDDEGYSGVRFSKNGAASSDYCKAVPATKPLIDLCDLMIRAENVALVIRKIANSMDSLSRYGVIWEEDLKKIESGAKRMKKLVESYMPNGDNL